MSRGGGRGGKRVRAQIRAKGEDEDGKPLVFAQPKPEDFQPPPLYPPLASTPQPFASPNSPRTTHYLHTARLLFDQHTYSGYRLTQPQRQTVQLQRYSDRYRRQPGQRQFLDECPHPSPFLFPAELQRWGDKQSGAAPLAAGSASRLLAMSAEALQSHLDRLTVVKDEVAVGEVGAAGMKEERKEGVNGLEAAEGEEKEEEGAGKRRGTGDDDEEEEDDEDAVRDDDEDDDMGGGDYTDRYQEDDDGEGGDDVFGDDDGDVM